MGAVVRSIASWTPWVGSLSPVQGAAGPAQERWYGEKKAGLYNEKRDTVETVLWEPNMSVPTVPCPPANRTECDPELPAPPTAAVYYLRNNKRPNTNYIRADITGLGYFHYDVRNEPDDGLGCPGTWLFEQAWLHFSQQNVAINGIRGDWTFGRNLDEINALTANGQMTLEEAAVHPSLWAFQRASSKGYTKVTVIDSDGNPGNYVSVDVVYSQ